MTCLPTPAQPWSVCRRTISFYLSLNSADQPVTDQQHVDSWVVQSSEAAQLNLVPFYVKWHWPVGATALAAAAKYKDIPVPYATTSVALQQRQAVAVVAATTVAVSATLSIITSAVISNAVTAAVAANAPASAASMAAGVGVATMVRHLQVFALTGWWLSKQCRQPRQLQ